MDVAAVDPVEEASSPRVRRAGLVLAPLTLLALLVVPVEGLPESAQRVMAVTACVAVLWLTQAIPIAAASLVPLVLIPLLGVASTRQVATLYVNDNTFLFLGGFLLALAIERCGLHRRIAGAVVGSLGGGPRRLSLGFMLLATGLSCWISNTACTLMLLPMGLAVIAHLAQAAPPRDEAESRALRNFSALLLLSIAYGASIGGLATPVGTPPNALFLGQLGTTYPDDPDMRVSFARWMIAMLPLVAVLAPLSWLLMERLVLPTGAVRERLTEATTRRLELPPMSRDEKVVAATFVTTALLWVFRTDIDLGGVTVPGWTSALGLDRVVLDGTVAILMPLLLFLLPSSERPGGRLLDWSVEPRIPWGVLLLFGAGFALAGLFESTGLAGWSGDVLAAHLPASPWLAVALTCAVVILMSELANNTATAAVLLPVAASVAASAGLHPFVLMVPVTIAASCGFALPVATAPNAIVFATGRVAVGQMARCGVLLDVLSLALITLFAVTWWEIVLW